MRGLRVQCQGRPRPGTHGAKTLSRLARGLTPHDRVRSYALRDWRHLDLCVDVTGTTVCQNDTTLNFSAVAEMPPSVGDLDNAEAAPVDELTEPVILAFDLPPSVEDEIGLYLA